MDSYHSQEYAHQVKCKQLCPEFKIGLLILFPMTITVMLNMPPTGKIRLDFQARECNQSRKRTTLNSKPNGNRASNSITCN